MVRSREWIDLLLGSSVILKYLKGGCATRGLFSTSTSKCSCTTAFHFFPDLSKCSCTTAFHLFYFIKKKMSPSFQCIKYRVSGWVCRGHSGCSAIQQLLKAVTSAAPQTCKATVNFHTDAGECNGLSVTPTNSVLSHPRAFFNPLSSRGGVALLEK